MTAKMIGIGLPLAKAVPVRYIFYYFSNQLLNVTENLLCRL